MLPEGLLNYLALLGWGLSEDRDVFSLQEMVEAFDIRQVNSNPARFDQKKADAINAEHIGALPPEEFSPRPPRLPALSAAWHLIRFLVVDESASTVDPQSAAKNLKAESREVVDAAIAALEAVEEWTTERIEQALSGALVDGMGIKPRKA